MAGGRGSRRDFRAVVEHTSVRLERGRCLITNGVPSGMGGRATSREDAPSRSGRYVTSSTPRSLRASPSPLLVTIRNHVRATLHAGSSIGNIRHFVRSVILPIAHNLPVAFQTWSSSEVYGQIRCVHLLQSCCRRQACASDADRTASVRKTLVSNALAPRVSRSDEPVRNAAALVEYRRGPG